MEEVLRASPTLPVPKPSGRSLLQWLQSSVQRAEKTLCTASRPTVLEHPLFSRVPRHPVKRSRRSLTLSDRSSWLKVVWAARNPLPSDSAASLSPDVMVMVLASPRPRHVTDLPPVQVVLTALEPSRKPKQQSRTHSSATTTTRPMMPRVQLSRPTRADLRHLEALR